MQGMTTLGNVWNRVDDLTRDCTDHLIATPDIRFDDLKTVRIAGEAHPLRSTAQSLIASRLGIPLSYLTKCPPEVQAYNLNYWIGCERNPKLFFRFDGQGSGPSSPQDTGPWTTSRSWSAWIPWAILLIPGCSAAWMGSSCP